jgi:integrase
LMTGTADYLKIDEDLIKANASLKAGESKVRIERRGGYLSLVACLPGKGADRRRRTRRISPGLPANSKGLQTAKRLALKLAGELVGDCFDWTNWVAEGEAQSPETKTVSQWIKEYRIHLDQIDSLKGDNAARDRQWRRDHWNPALKWLDQSAQLSDQAIKMAALHHDAVGDGGKPSRARQLACIRLGQFAKWAGIDVDLSPYRGKYSPSQVVRNIPTDEEIKNAVQSLENSEWRWIAGMMGAFGLRNHECWFTELVQDEIGWLAKISEGKTGSRTARPLHPDWVEEFDLPDGKAPNIKCRGHSEYGERAARHFKRSKIGFCPYDLRHAYAIRGSLQYEIPVAVMASWLGHSPAVFLRIYSKHLSAAIKNESYKKAVAGYKQPTGN